MKNKATRRLFWASSVWGTYRRGDAPPAPPAKKTFLKPLTSQKKNWLALLFEHLTRIFKTLTHDKETTFGKTARISSPGKNSQAKAGGYKENPFETRTTYTLTRAGKGF